MKSSEQWFNSPGLKAYHPLTHSLAPLECDINPRHNNCPATITIYRRPMGHTAKSHSPGAEKNIDCVQEEKVIQGDYKLEGRNSQQGHNKRTFYTVRGRNITIKIIKRVRYAVAFSATGSSERVIVVKWKQPKALRPVVTQKVFLIYTNKWISGWDISVLIPWTAFYSLRDISESQIDLRKTLTAYMSPVHETNFLLCASNLCWTKAILQILHEICSSGPTKTG